MVPTLRIDTTKINAAFREIAHRAGVPDDRVVEYESGKILEGAVKSTPAASVSKIRKSHEAQTFGRFDTGKGRKTYNLDYRYPDPVWKRIVAARKASLKRKLAARGLAKRSWLELAEAYGLSINTPAFVQAAIARTGKRYDNSTAKKVRRSGRVGIYFENRQPTVQIVGGRRAILKAINGRERYFRMNVKKGVFNDLKAVARAYPGMRVT